MKRRHELFHLRDWDSEEARSFRPFQLRRLALLAVVALLLVGAAVAAPPNLIGNGGFEQSFRTLGNVAKDIGFGVWRLGENHLGPLGWNLNPAYPGALEMVEDGTAPTGRRFLRVKANVDEKHHRGAHLYIAATGLKEGGRYRLAARVRGGAAAIGLYEYKQDRSMRAVTVLEAKPSGEWRELSGVYEPPKGFRNAYVAVMVPWGEMVELDEIQLVDEAALSEATSAGLALENEEMALEIGPDARLKRFVCKAIGQDYALAGGGAPVCAVTVKGKRMQAVKATREGAFLALEFPEPGVKVSLLVQARRRYFTVEVAGVLPEETEALSIEFPLKKLSAKSTITAANFDDAFVANAFALDERPFCTVRQAGEGAAVVAADFERRHGFAGGRVALIGVPRGRFFAVAQEVEKDAGLPSPKLDGKWLRESDPIRRSYLMVMEMRPGDVETLIEYAKIGGFQTIVFAKDVWLASHGHYRINERCFPGGFPGFQEAVAKIHGAGLKAGVHLFGPSISPEDAYVTPVPDRRLSAVACPPLAEAVDETATTISLTCRPEAWTPAGFPENHLRIGDEIIRYGRFEEGTPFRFIGCERGAYGTRAAPHAAGAPVQGLLTKLGYFMLAPDSPLLEEVAEHFARVVNACNLDLVYFDASDCEAQARPMGFDLRRYVDRCHYAFYRKFDHDVLYQTSVGLGFNLQWHLVARGASANGFGDIKKLLAKKMRILLYASHFAYADVGWYGLDPAIRTNAIEYIAAKCLGCDGSISIQGSRASLEAHPQGREILEMLRRYEHCRFHRVFPKETADLLLARDKDFRLYGAPGQGWRLCEAHFCPDHYVVGKSDAWTVTNPWPEPQPFALELLRYPVYDNPDAVILEDFSRPADYATGGAEKPFVRLLAPAARTLSACGAASADLRHSLGQARYPVYFGEFSGVFQAANDGGATGWALLGKEFPQPLDLRPCHSLALWARGDGKGALLEVTLFGAEGGRSTKSVRLDYTGWRLAIFPLDDAGGLDRAQVRGLALALKEIPAKARVTCMLGGVKALPGVVAPELSGMELLVNGERIAFPGKLEAGESLTTDGSGKGRVWPGGMGASREIAVPGSALKLKPGENRVEFRHRGRGDGVYVRVIPLRRIAGIDK